MLLLNDEEARQLSGQANLPAAARAIRAMGPSVGRHQARRRRRAAVSRGGACSRRPRSRSRTSSIPTGAGDSFAGGFMGWLAREGNTEPATIRTSMIMGSVLASFSVEDFSLDRFRAAGPDPDPRALPGVRRSGPLREDQALTVAAPLILTAASAADTQALAARLGRLLAAGDVLALVGPLGAGKTTFVQGLARGLDVPPDRNVASPTFALVTEHPGRVPLVHADLYRIEDAARADGARADRRVRSRRGRDRMARPLPRRRPRRSPGDHDCLRPGRRSHADLHARRSPRDGDCRAPATEPALTPTLSRKREREKELIRPPLPLAGEG